MPLVSISRSSAEGRMMMWPIFVAPIKAGITTRLAPERISFRSVEGDSARAMISIVAFRSRAVSVTKTLAVSSGSTTAMTRARSMPAACRVASSLGAAEHGQVARRPGLRPRAFRWNR